MEDKKCRGRRTSRRTRNSGRCIRNGRKRKSCRTLVSSKYRRIILSRRMISRSGRRRRIIRDRKNISSRRRRMKRRRSRTNRRWSSRSKRGRRTGRRGRSCGGGCSRTSSCKSVTAQLLIINN